MEEIFELRLDEISVVAIRICELLPERNLVLLKGNLGAGKTTLVKEVCKILGIENEVSSPSFGLINEYNIKNLSVFHIDLYRLNNIDEFWSIGGADYIDSTSPCLIEWPELIVDFVDVRKTINVEIKNLGREIRKYLINYN
ncbi:MAG: tRNA (adenosine(37)-N6)-threonylcarbamoyltransferase complex ATPase subunit type 1 TsaE [Bacteroidetes bacterium]|nr:tRNA (adenosine(37)-N6)-threonylcarbamoyltransferase complex ATPase subunit type 1 TsaE [Bacteroidota bacterium]